MFLKGFIIGFSIAAIVGPIALLCIKRTLASGRMSGLISGFGAATAHVVYGLIAALGLTAISDFLLNHRGQLQLVGGLFLCYLGLTTFFSKSAEAAHGTLSASLVRDYVSTFFLTLTNPITILSYMAAFAGLNITTDATNYSSGLMLTLGVFTGAMSWWFILISMIGFFHKSLTQAGIVIVNRISGCIIFAFGCWALVGFLKSII